MLVVIGCDTPRDVEVEAGSGKRVPLPLGPFISNVKTWMRCNFLKNIRRKVKVWSIMICKETFLKTCGSLRFGAAPIPMNSKMNHVANQLILKTIHVQKFSILILEFKNFLKNTFRRGFAHLWGPYSYKTSFTNIYKVSTLSILISFSAVIYSWKANEE